MKTTRILKTTDLIINMLITMFTIMLFIETRMELGTMTYMLIGTYHMLSFILNLPFMIRKKAYSSRERMPYICAAGLYGICFYIALQCGFDIDDTDTVGAYIMLVLPAILGSWYISICVRETIEVYKPI